jgi:hypothetical protein
MQTFILPDYLDGSKVSKNENLNLLSKFCMITDYMELVDDVLIKINYEPTDYLNGIPVSSLVEFINSDESLKVFLRAYKGYLESPNNYIVGKNLIEAMFHTSLDIKVKYLPKDFKAFLDLKGLKDQDGELIQGVFVDIRTIQEKYCFTMGMLAFNTELNSYTISHLNIPLEDTESTIEDIILKQKEIYRILADEDYQKIKNGEEVPNLKAVEKVTEASFHKHIQVIFNIILFIHNSVESCVKTTNVFADKKSKREGQEKVYTKKEFSLVGQNFVFPKEFSCGVVGVTGHFRWQPHGPARSLVKHIYIKPHVRNYDKIKEVT